MCLGELLIHTKRAFEALRLGSSAVFKGEQGTDKITNTQRFPANF